MIFQCHFSILFEIVVGWYRKLWQPKFFHIMPNPAYTVGTERYIIQYIAERELHFSPFSLKKNPLKMVALSLKLTWLRGVVKWIVRNFQKWKNWKLKTLQSSRKQVIPWRRARVDYSRVKCSQNGVFRRLFDQTSMEGLVYQFKTLKWTLQSTITIR